MVTEKSCDLKWKIYIDKAQPQKEETSQNKSLTALIFLETVLYAYSK